MVKVACSARACARLLVVPLASLAAGSPGAATSLTCPDEAAIPPRFADAVRLCSLASRSPAVWDPARPPATTTLREPVVSVVLAAAPLPRAVRHPRTALPALRPVAPGPTRALDLDIARVASRHRIDPLLLASLVEAESGFRIDAVSRKGALGLTQVMPATARELGVSEPDRLLEDVDLALDTGARYLLLLHRRFGNDLPLLLAGYNAGPGAVARHGGVPPYAETRAYVRRVLAGYQQRQRETSGGRW